MNIPLAKFRRAHLRSIALVLHKLLHARQLHRECRESTSGQRGLHGAQVCSARAHAAHDVVVAENGVARADKDRRRDLGKSIPVNAVSKIN